MITLGALHYVYIIMTVIIIAVLLLKKEIVLPCIIGVFLMGLVSSGGNVISAIQVMYNSLVSSSNEFMGIIIVIALVVSMSKCLSSIGADELMISPLKKVIKTQKVAFFAVGCVMLIASWFIWPSPAVALVGAILLPVALKSGLPAIWAAVAMNLFGHGLGLSGDYFIQGAPAISAKAAGLSTTDVMAASIPLWAVMSVVTIAVAFVLFLRDMKKGTAETTAVEVEAAAPVKATRFAYFIAILTPLAFVIDVILMIVFKIVGGDATALVGGTAVIIMCIILIFRGHPLNSLDDITDMVKDGFIFAIKIFAPVIVIASFFFMGSGEMAAKVLGEGAPNILTDLGMSLANAIPMAKIPVAIMQALIGIVTGLDGSGFSGLPLIGSLAQTFSIASGANVATLTALGQLVTVWVGGGTVIPWAVIPVAAICNVKAADLARKNLIPVVCGLGATLLVSFFLI